MTSVAKAQGKVEDRKDGLRGPELERCRDPELEPTWDLICTWGTRIGAERRRGEPKLKPSKNQVNEDPEEEQEARLELSRFACLNYDTKPV